MPDLDVIAARAMGMRAADAAARAQSPTRIQGVSRDFAEVTKVYGNGFIDVDKGSENHPMPMRAIRTTTACDAVKVGDTVVVDTYAHVPLVTGVIATSANRPAPDTRRFVYCLDFGTTVMDFTNRDAVNLMTLNDFKERYGRSFLHGNDILLGMNGDSRAQAYMNTVTAFISSDAIGFYASGMNERISGAARITWALLTNLPVEG